MKINRGHEEPREEKRNYWNQNNQGKMEEAFGFSGDTKARKRVRGGSKTTEGGQTCVLRESRRNEWRAQSMIAWGN